MSVFVEDAAEPVASADIETGDLAWIGGRCGQGTQVGGRDGWQCVRVRGRQQLRLSTLRLLVQHPDPDPARISEALTALATSLYDEVRTAFVAGCAPDCSLRDPPPHTDGVAVCPVGDDEWAAVPGHRAPRRGAGPCR
ncbi:hypothetical protein [Streptomyces sp. NPDC002758]